ncbi:MAG TPA: glycosyltransferase family 39 protein [Candidatus Acidoferrales bacterium]|nr:glycosyltransferase family 39 protein [Candidatus Acidoferrales bacterium]
MAAFSWFAVTVEKSGIASVFCDPVSGIASQDEAVYGREAIEMASRGNFLTPTYLGRYVLNKPPLMQELAALSVRVFGPSAFAVRLPSLLAAALTASLIFSLAWRMYSLPAALCAAVLLASSHLFYVFARFCMTDMLLVMWLTLAMFAISVDPAMRTRRFFWLFSVASGAAILTKAAAGLLPLIALVVNVGLVPRESRPRVLRVVSAIFASLAIALPWHLYQLAVHSRWFLAEYVWTAHFLVGVAAPPQYSSENHLVFYARRMFLMDPVLSVLAVAALIPLARNWRRRTAPLAWLAAALLVLCAFRYRSAYYLLPAIPALALVATESLRMIPRRAQAAALAVLAICCTTKIIYGAQAWGIPANLESQRSSAPALEHYCELHRSNGLILVNPDDEFYASILPIAQVRYALLQPQPPSPPIDYAYLGIWMPAGQFARLRDWLPLYHGRLRSFRLDSDRAIGSVIWARSDAEIGAIIEGHPESDFSLPAKMATGLNPASHVQMPGGPGRVFLLSQTTGTYSEARACKL